MISSRQTLASVAYLISGLSIGYMGYSWAPAVYLALLVIQAIIGYVSFRLTHRSTLGDGGLGGFVYLGYLVGLVPVVAAVLTPLILPRMTAFDHKVLAAYVAIPMTISYSTSIRGGPQNMALALFINLVLPLAAVYYYLQKTNR